MLPGPQARRNDDILTENEILNALLPCELVMPILAFMNRYLKQHCKTITDFVEFEPFLRSIFALSYYKCSVLDVETHPKTHPLVADNVNNLKGNTFKQKVRRLNTLLRSFQGAEKPGPEDCGDSISFAQVYQHDRELEKLFRDLGGHVSGLAFIRAVTQLIIDDDKLRMRSAKVAELSLIRSKSGKAFGSVGNCMHSSLLGVQLACTYTQFGDSALDSIQSNLSIITGVNNPKQVKLSDTLIGGDRKWFISSYSDTP